MKIAVLYNTSDYLLKFRTELLCSMRTAGCELVAVTPRDDETHRLQGLGVRWIEWPVDGQGLNPLGDLKSVVQLRNILRRERPDAILNFTVKPVLYGSLVARQLGIGNVVSMITGMGSMFLPGGASKRAMQMILTQAYRIALRGNFKVFFQNDEDLEHFVRGRLVRADQAIRTNGSGVNLGQFVPTEDPVHQGSFLLIARMIREKGIREFIEAARIVKAEYPAATFTLVGPIDNNPGAITRDELTAWERQGLIRYQGAQADVRPYLRETEVYVLPSYYLEGVPRSILEALAMAKPIITTDWRGCRDTVVNGVNGWLIAPKSPGELAEAMMRFLRNPSMSVQFGAESRRLAVAKFDVDVVNRTIMAALGVLQ